jgi:hypothetical protein
MEFNFFNENNRRGNCIFEYPVVPFPSKHPNSGKPKNPEKYLCRDRHTRHSSELNEMMLKLTIMHKRNGQPTQNKGPKI